MSNGVRRDVVIQRLVFGLLVTGIALTLSSALQAAPVRQAAPGKGDTAGPADEGTAVKSAIVPEAVATAPPPPCSVQFVDVPPTNTFYSFVRCLACRNIIDGYTCGGPGEPCNAYNDPYFRPNNYVTRGQLTKIVALSAAFSEIIPPGPWTFADVQYGSTFWLWVERLANRGIISGYPCGGPGEPCDAESRPYFRPYTGATRGQVVKIVTGAAGFLNVIPPAQQTFADVLPGSTYWLYIERLSINRPAAAAGYVCGGPGEPCDSANRQYFRPNNPLTRGQTAKIVSSVFYPGCWTP